MAKQAASGSSDPGPAITPTQATVVVRPEAELQARPHDEILNSDELQTLELFGTLKKRISVEKFPGSIVLRRFRAGEAICRQGERGNSAFYITTAHDLLKLRKLQLEREPDRAEWLQKAIAELEQDLLRRQETAAGSAEPSPGRRRAATARIYGGGVPPRPKGFLRSWLAPRPAPSGSNRRQGPRSNLIPNDGPTDIDYDTRQAPMFEGDVFGEMSCMTLAPRSATVVADQDCYLVEFLRNIFDQMQKDAGYRERMDRVYEERVLEGHLQRLEFFRDLNPDQLNLLRKGVRLEIVDPGTVICGEGDTTDDVYLIRSGMVQVVKGVNVTVHPSDIEDWASFCGRLTEGSKVAPPAKPEAKKSGAADILAAARAGKAKQADPGAAPKGKSSADDILAAARAAKAKKAGGEAGTPAAGADEAKPGDTGAAKPKGKMTPDQIMAAARAAKAKKAEGEAGGPATGSDEAKPKAKMTPDEIMAAARAAKAKKAEGDAGAPGAGADEAKPKAKMTPDEIMAAARAAKAKKAEGEAGGPATGADEAKPKGKMTPDEIMAAARAAKAKKAEGDAGAPAAKSDAAGAAKPKSAMSPADILAAARAGKGKQAEDGTGSTSTNPAAGASKPKAAMSPADILAAARSKKAAASEPEEPQEPPRIVAKAPKPLGSPAAAVWNWLAPHVRKAVEAIAAGKGTDEGRALVADALNDLIRCRDFVASKDVEPVLQTPDVLPTVRTFPGGIQGVKRQWTELEVRLGGRMALQAIYPRTFPKQATAGGPPRILDYMSRGDCFGEMAMLLKQPRQASCVAYDHPQDDASRKPGRVELVRIEAQVFRQLLEQSPPLKSQIDALVAERQGNIRRASEQRPWDEHNPLVSTPEFRDEGLVQGQSLLLIDLDRCTRCGDCVRACINTHADGYSRLFLDGPRFDRYLVPSACRKCLNPSCMIGCPVGSIQRGNNGQIEIRDWCIGCGLCARQCPYDSIQMHDIGIIPEASIGWEMLPESAVSDRAWYSRKKPRGVWAFGVGPFEWTLELQQELGLRAAGNQNWHDHPETLPEPICFRYEFNLEKAQWQEHDEYRLLIVSEGLDAEAWVNGKSVELRQDAKQAKKGEFEATLTRDQLRRGACLLAVRISPRVADAPGDTARSASEAPKLRYQQPVLSARLDAVTEAGQVTEETVGEQVLAEVELVTEKAVVCDLCSSLATQSPACVDQCPHDAAFRVDARFDFPGVS